MAARSGGRRLADNAANAVGRRMRISPRKLSLVADTIRGLAVDAAISRLAFSRRRIARAVRKVVESAVANAENLDPGIDVDDGASDYYAVETIQPAFCKPHQFDVATLHGWLKVTTLQVASKPLAKL